MSWIEPIQLRRQVGKPLERLQVLRNGGIGVEQVQRAQVDHIGRVQGAIVSVIEYQPAPGVAGRMDHIESAAAELNSVPILIKARWRFARN